MPDDNLIWIAPLIFLLAGTIKGAIGLGLPTTIIALMSLFVDPRVAVALGLTAMILSNVWQAHREGGWIQPLARFWPYLVISGAALLAVSQFAAEADGDAILVFTGIAIVIFAVSSLIGSPPALPPRWERPAQVFTGGVAGVMGGLTGIWSPPMIMMLLSLRLDKRAFVNTVGVLLCLGAAPLQIGYVAAGLMTWKMFGLSLALCVPVFIGFSVGERFRRRVDAALFQNLVLLFFLAMGLNMIRQGW
ncbi:MAG: sulfite exporter TauE/SafE family protein [Pseudomonadota bacterium]